MSNAPLDLAQIAAWEAVAAEANKAISRNSANIGRFRLAFTPDVQLRILAALRGYVEREAATCEWDYDGFDWRTSCGNLWGLRPTLYCASCGRRVVVAEERGEDE